LLLSRGADVHALDSLGHTPLQAAAFNGNCEIGRLLIPHGADVNFAKAGTESALSIAIKRGKKEFAALLQKCGASES
jgi:uncharacterized protein